MYKQFNAKNDEPVHALDRKVFHAPGVHVMETLGEPLSPFFAYQPGMYVYVHDHALETNPLAAQECVVEDVTNAPLEIVVAPCNHPEAAFTVSQDKLSAPIWV